MIWDYTAQFGLTPSRCSQVQAVFDNGAWAKSKQTQASHMTAASCCTRACADAENRYADCTWATIKHSAVLLLLLSSVTHSIVAGQRWMWDVHTKLGKQRCNGSAGHILQEDVQSLLSLLSTLHMQASHCVPIERVASSNSSARIAQRSACGKASYVKSHTRMLYVVSR